ncbi:hypothetical protein ACIGXI_36140 [Kitasatospora aureofaciens]|uniref:hypothetical protein n=1 Tax=Kitasatospora aureofaciens TaxID=1894 RepID=UPI0037CB1237
MRSTSRRTPPRPWPAPSARRSRNCTADCDRPRPDLEHLAITRDTVKALADRLPAGTSPPETSEHPDYPRILAAFNEATGPLRARDVCEALDHELLAKTIEKTRAKLKRLVKLDILTEIGPRSFTRKK